MKINFKVPFLQITGEDVVEDGKIQYMHEALANRLVMSKNNDPMRFLEWARVLYATGVLDIERSDQDTLRTFLKNLDDVVLVKAQLLERFDDELIKSKKKNSVGALYDGTETPSPVSS